MSEAFRVQMTIGGDASGAKRAAAEATTAVKGLSVSTTDAATAAQAHVLALGAEAAVATRLTMAEAAVAAQITKASTEQRAALSAIVPLTAQAQAASLGLGSTLQAMTGAQAAVSGGTRVLGADMARLAGVDTQVRTATDAAVRALIDQSHAYDALRVELAPAITAEQRFAAVQAQVAAAVAAGLTTQREANVVIDQARAKYAALPAVMAGVEKGAFAAGGGTYRPIASVRLVVLIAAALSR